jgi:lipopolysaccharide biosynthesis regulator YciM
VKHAVCLFIQNGFSQERACNWNSVGAILVVISVLLSQSALSHGSIHERLLDVDEKIEKDKSNAAHYLSRSMLYVEDREYTNALRDIDTVQKLDHKFPRLDFHRGFVFYKQAMDAGNDTFRYLNASKVYLSRHLAANPGDFKARIYNAKVLAALNRNEQAFAEYRQGIDGNPELDIDSVSEAVKTMEVLGKHQTGEEFVQEMIVRFGSVPGLVRLLIDLHYRKGHIDEAVRWHSRLPRMAREQPSVMIEHARMLYEAGRTDESRIILCSAEKKLARLPDNVRQSRRIQQLVDQIQSFDVEC